MKTERFSSVNNCYADFAPFYDELMEDVNYQELADYYEELINEHSNPIAEPQPPILLDLACGTGTLTALMAKRGWDVIGVDSSQEMLSRTNQHPNVSYVCQNMTELDLFGTIHAAVCTFDGLNHLENEDELAESLGRVSLFMESGGVFVFDMNTIYKHETILAENIYIKECDNIYCVWQNSYQGNGVVDINLNIFAKYYGKFNGYARFDVEITEKAYETDTVRQLCEQAGFDVVAVHNYLTRENPNPKSEKVVYVCKKR
jgi:ubiquinone/menaquinone biosynthesis C-methylase UbiE